MSDRWFRDLPYDRIVRFVAKTETDACFETKEGGLFVKSRHAVDVDFEHLPDCDSFDWQPETFPQFYRGERWADYEAYVRFDSKYEPGKVFYDNGSIVICNHYNFSEVEENCRLYGWKKLTQAEAEARVKKPQRNILADCQDCGEFRGHGHDEICKGRKLSKREYFRLWTHRTSGTVCTSPQEALKYPDIWTELKHDGTGFYLEDGK